jgi:hypothetical protein
MKVAQTFNNEKQKLKLKKHALEYVDYEMEKRCDPKYKTELCKSWNDTNFCVYGNKCRFAHGRHELSGKPIDHNKYKVKECNSFKELGFCMYGTRCNFKHDERKIDSLDRSYYYFKLMTEHNFTIRKNFRKERLPVFEKYTEAKTAESSPISQNIYSIPIAPKNLYKQSCFNFINARLS